jgi:WhiB family transcriptional regulator, redox-sensing transcriptional regulator
MDEIDRGGGLDQGEADPLGWAPTPDDSLIIDLPDEPEQPEWQERALCAQTDPEAFFPEKGGSTREAKRICLGCEVRAECLEYALAHDERFGIWGGLSERERRRLKRRAV